MKTDVGSIVEQLTINRKTLQEGGFYEEETDFKVKTTDNLVDDVKNYYRNEKNSGFSLGFQKTDEDSNFLVRRGEVTILTGSSGSGKTTFLSQVLLNLMTYTNVLVASIALYSFMNRICVDEMDIGQISSQLVCVHVNEMVITV